MNIRSWLSFVFCVSCVLPAQSVPAGAPKIVEHTLSAVWRAKLDYENIGVSTRWFAPEFKEDGWTPINTHRWSGWDQQGMPQHVGVGWYRLRTKVPQTLRGKHAYIYLSAVDEEGWVWVNGHPVGEHTYAGTKLHRKVLWQTPFAFEISDQIRFGQVNNFAVRVNNVFGGAGGVWQPVHLFTSDVPLSFDQMKKRADTLNQKILAGNRNPVRYEAWTSENAYDPIFSHTAWSGTATENDPAATAVQSPKASRAHNLSGPLQVQGASGEMVPMAIHVRNQGSKALLIRMHLHQVSHVDDGSFMLNSDRVDVHIIDFVRIQTGELIPDPLPRADGINSLKVLPNETGSYFVTIDTSGLPAGLWKGDVHLTPIRDGPRLQIPFQLRIVPAVLPQQLPIWMTMWTYDPGWMFVNSLGRGSEDAYLALMRRTGFNAVITRSSGMPMPILDDNGDLEGIDTRDLDYLLARRQFDANQHFLVVGLLLEATKHYWSLGGEDILGEKWNRNFIKYVRLLSRHVRENLRVPYERWGLYLQDERISENEGFPAFGKLTREADPRVQIWANAIQELDVVKKAEPYIDVFVPKLSHLSWHPDSANYMREKGKIFWIYDNAGARPPNKTAVPRSNPHSPHRNLRMHGWQAWNLDLKGVSYWLLVGKWWSRYSGFDESARGNYANCSFVYVGHDGPVTSRRLEAYREGLEDYKLLWTIDQAAGAIGQDQDLARKAREHINASVESVLAKPRTTTELLRWREILLEDAAKLCSNMPLEAAVVEVTPMERGAVIELETSTPVRVWTWLRAGGIRPPIHERNWTLAASLTEPTVSPKLTITGLVPGQRGQVTFVIAGPEGQQKVIRHELLTQPWPRR